MCSFVFITHHTYEITDTHKLSHNSSLQFNVHILTLPRHSNSRNTFCPSGDPSWTISGCSAYSTVAISRAGTSTVQDKDKTVCGIPKFQFHIVCNCKIHVQAVHYRTNSLRPRKQHLLQHLLFINKKFSKNLKPLFCTARSRVQGEESSFHCVKHEKRELDGQWVSKGSHPPF